MRSSDAFLLDIVEASARISEYTAGMSRADFMADRKTQAAVVREIEIIGENRKATIIIDPPFDPEGKRMRG